MSKRETVWVAYYDAHYGTATIVGIFREQQEAHDWAKARDNAAKVAPVELPAKTRKAVKREQK